MFQPTELSISDVKPLIDIAFTFVANMNQLWNYFLVFSGVVIGWRFSAKEQWEPWQKWIVTLVYSLFALLNGWALWAIYDSLGKVLLEVNSAAGKLNNQYPHIQEVMRQSEIVGGKWLAAFIYIGGWVLVIICVSRGKYIKGSGNKNVNPETPAPRLDN